MAALIWRILVMQIICLACEYSETGRKGSSFYLNRSISLRFCNVSIWRGEKQLGFHCLHIWNLVQKIALHLMMRRLKMAKILYASAVGSLIYAMVATCIDIVFAMGVVSRYMANLGKKHWEAVKILWNTSKAQRICAFALERWRHLSLAMLVTQILESLLLGICLFSQDEWSLRSPSYRSVLHCLLPRQSM